LYARVTPNVIQKSFSAEVLDAEGNCYLSLNGYQTVALPDLVSAERLKNLQAIMSGEAVVAA
jgi:hypothetical protein